MFRKKQKINFIITILILLVTVNISMAYFSPNSQYLKIRDAETYNTTYLSDYFVNQDPDPAVPGGFVDLRWKIDNLGSEPIDNLTFEVLPEYPLSLEKGEKAVKHYGTMYPGQIGEDGIVLHYRLKVDGEAAEGDYNVGLRYKYDDTGWLKRGDYQIRVRPHDATLAVNNVGVSPGSVEPGSEAEIIITLENKAGVLLKNLQVSLDVTDTPVTPTGTSSEKVVDTLESGEEKSVIFKVVSDPEAVSNLYKVPFTIKYSDRLGNDYTKDSSLGLKIFSEPEFIVHLDESEIKRCNSRGNVFVSISNTGTSKIKYLTTMLHDSEYYEVMSSKTVYVGNLESDDYETVQYELFLNNNSCGMRSVPLSFDYKDTFNKDFNQEINNLEIRTYNKKEALQLGLEKKSALQGPVGLFINLVVGLLVLAFMAFMIIDCVKNKLPWYKKVIWIILILTVIGAVLYFFIARKTY